MKSSITKRSSRVTLTLVTGGVGEKARVSSPFGPVRAGLITMQSPVIPMVSHDQLLTELLNSLEKEVATLVFRSFEVLNTFEHGTTHLVEPTSIVLDSAGTDTLRNR